MIAFQQLYGFQVVLTGNASIVSVSLHRNHIQWLSAWLHAWCLCRNNPDASHNRFPPYLSLERYSIDRYPSIRGSSLICIAHMMLSLFSVSSILCNEIGCIFNSYRISAVVEIHLPVYCCAFLQSAGASADDNALTAVVLSVKRGKGGIVVKDSDGLFANIFYGYTKFTADVFKGDAVVISSSVLLSLNWLPDIMLIVIILRCSSVE